MKTDSALHAGHRQRMRERLYKTGLNGFQPHEILEIILYSAIPKKDVNPLAHALIDRFGSLDGVFSASREELLSVSGVGPRTCDLIAAVNDMCASYMENRFTSRPRLASTSQAVELALPLFTSTTERETVILMQDAAGTLLSVRAYSSPINNPACVREILSLALMLNTSSVILVTRRAGAARKPGQTELDAYSRLMTALSCAEIYLFDFLYIAGNKILSLKLEGLLRDQSSVFRDTLPYASGWFDSLAQRRPPDGWFTLDELP